jgi:pimeloyl-ACP methyl ester carboxylesterase
MLVRFIHQNIHRFVGRHPRPAAVPQAPVRSTAVPDVTANGVRLSYQIDGPVDGEPVVLVCGTGQPAVTWQMALGPTLVAAGYRVVSFDNRGVEPSEAPPPPYSVADMAADAAGLIEALQLGPCWVAGLSLGALITQELALARPDLVRGAVMMGTLGRSNVMLRAWAEAYLEVARAGTVLPARLQAVATAMQVISPAHQLDDAFIGPWLELMEAAPPWEGPGQEGQYAADLAYDDRLGALSGVAVPALVIGFEHDLITPTALGREVAEAIPGATYREVPGCGHLGPIESSEAVLPALLDFFGAG